MNIGVHMSLSILVSSVCMPSTGIAGSYGHSISHFLRNLHTVLLSGYTSLHSHQQCKRYLFSTPASAFIVCRFFDDGPSDQCEMISHCGFDLHFSDNEWCWASFHAFISHLYAFFGEMPMFWLGYFFFWYWGTWTACIFWRLILYKLFHFLLFSPILRAIFSLCL